MLTKRDGRTLVLLAAIAMLVVLLFIATADAAWRATPTPTASLTAEPSPSASYLLYDNFSTFDSDTWVISVYKPRSSFIDTSLIKSNVWLDDGGLVIWSDVDNRTGGEIKSKDLFYPGTRYRTSMRVDQTTGTYITIFNYMWAGGNGGEKHNEIDIELIDNGTNTTAMLSTWFNGKRNYKAYALPFDPAAAYHVYGYDWYKDRVDFYIDGKLVWTSRSKIPTQATYLYLNSWVVTNVPAGHGNGQNAQYVDWVTVNRL